METSIVRINLMTDKDYRPYCGADSCVYTMPRSKWNGSQFECKCGWVSEFPADFITRYKEKHNL
jgi:hypothetical protein